MTRGLLLRHLTGTAPVVDVEDVMVDDDRFAIFASFPPTAPSRAAQQYLLALRDSHRQLLARRRASFATPSSAPPAASPTSVVTPREIIPVAAAPPAASPSFIIPAPFSSPVEDDANCNSDTSTATVVRDLTTIFSSSSESIRDVNAEDFDSDSGMALDDGMDINSLISLVITSSSESESESKAESSESASSSDDERTERRKICQGYIKRMRVKLITAAKIPDSVLSVRSRREAYAWLRRKYKKAGCDEKQTERMIRKCSRYTTAKRKQLGLLQ